MGIYIHVYIHIYTYIYICVCVCVCLYIYIYVFIYIYFLLHPYPDSKFAGAPESILYGIFTQVWQHMGIYIYMCVFIDR